MGAPRTQLQSLTLEESPQTLRWAPWTRVAFRFCFVYFSLYCFSNQIITGLLPISSLEVPDPATKWPIRPMVTWVAIHIFGVKTELVYFSGSGDKTFDWVLAFCLLLFAIAATALWSGLDRKRVEYATLHKWFRVFLRFCLAGQMFGYGVVKVVPLQMPFPYLTKLVEPYGNFSPMGVLWASIGASPGYEIFAGCAETIGGVLLIFPRTVILGALVCLADMIQVFTLNMTYDVPVKLFSFHLILLCVFLLAPDFRRLADFFFRDRGVAPSFESGLFRTIRRNRIAVAIQIVFGVVLFGLNVYGSVSAWHEYGGGSVRSALYGIWDVTQMSIDGQIRTPLLTDYDRWRRVVFQLPSRVDFQRMDDSFARYRASIQTKQSILELTKDDDKTWKASFVFQRPTPSQLILDGTMDGKKILMNLQLFDATKFLLVSRGFHWIQEYPFNR